VTVYNSLSDAELIALLAESNQIAYRALFARYWEQTYNQVYKRLKDHDIAEDITQDIFMQLWARRSEKQILNIGGYLFGAARNSVFRALERQNRFVVVADLLNDVESPGERTDGHLLTVEFMKAYEALVDALPEGQRVIFRMRFQEDLSPDEIARKLNISPKTVRNQLGRAIASLKDSLLMFSIILSMLK